MYSKKRPLNNLSGSQEASPIASPKGGKNNFSTTPKSSGKKHKKRKLIQKSKVKSQKSKVKNQKSKVKSQKSKFKIQNSKVKSQKSKVKSQKSKVKS